MGLSIDETTIPGVKVIALQPFHDDRGSFARLFCARDLATVLEERQIVQINHSLTRFVGAVRGFHFQRPPRAEIKFVRCLQGRVFDVALDLRRGSPTFLRWHAQELSAVNGLMMVIPEGCAHGFQVLESDSELLYLHTEYYAPDHEDGIRYDDPKLDIPWPLVAGDISRRDLSHPLLIDAFKGLTL